MHNKTSLPLSAPGDWRFPFLRPALPPIETWQKDLEQAYDRRWFSNNGVLVRRLEAELGHRTGGTVVTAVNGTAGLTAALLALGLPHGAEVALPAFTFPATLCAVLNAGLMPVLADVDTHTWELSIQGIEAAFVGRPPAAVVAVRAFGLCRDLAPLERACRAWNAPLVVDAAAALGGVLTNGLPVGTQGRMEVFSLHATKAFAVGEGGAITAVAPADAETLRCVMNFGLDGLDWRVAGLNGKMSEFTAVVGLAQNAAFDAQVANRRAAASRYAKFFATHFPAWELPVDTGEPVWQTFPVLAPEAQRAEALMEHAARSGIQLRRYYRPALHRSPAGRGYARSPLPVSADLADRMVCLPMYPDWTSGEQDQLLAELLTIIRRL